jgi:phosphatidylglycerol:prolipoprotein diacylglycerol transferase
MLYPDIDPVAFAVGPLKVHWYGLMYLVGFAAAWALGRLRARRPNTPLSARQVDDLLFYLALGVIVGGRLGYILFYNFDAWLADPLALFRVWEGGMSFHGGFLGVLVAALLFARRHRVGFWQQMDFVAPLVPIGLLTGRIGNFINGELWGGPAASGLPWAMQLRCTEFVGLCRDKLGLPPGTEFTPALHPSQLYEAALEGLLMFVVLWLYSSRPRPTMAVSALFLICYGVFRFAVEFVRMPDAHLGYLAFGWLTMGQLLSAPMVLVGLLLFALAYRRNAA